MRHNETMTYRVLMVCTGNICRSPMAQQVLTEAVKEEGLDVIVDSAGVSNEEEGNPIDRRAARVLREAGYGLPDHWARQIHSGDIGQWDLILAMTDRHRSRLLRLADAAGVSVLPEAEAGDPSSVDIRLFRDFDPQAHENALDVPDPWYGGHEDYVETLAIIESAKPQIMEHLRQVTRG
ncbi:MAG: protein tyrosine phosphatase [Actinobacteria bacterium]|nr:MAG: protein tyrosine phosphatase [Actinomycetota bacterium]